MTLFNINIDRFDPDPEFVRVRDTHIGKSVYSERPYPASAVIGQITGDLSDDPVDCDEYSFEIDDKFVLNPHAPFRFLNHSCEPNCEFDFFHQAATENRPAISSLFLVAIRNIQPHEALTIDYNWPAEFAIPCDCREPACRGWIVARDELARLESS